MKKIIENLRKIYKPILLISVAFLLLISVFAIPSKDKAFLWTDRITERNLVQGENYFSRDNMIINFSGYRRNFEGLYIEIRLPYPPEGEGIKIYVYGISAPYEPQPGDEPEYIIINDRNLEELKLVTTRYNDSVVNYLLNNSRITKFICQLNNGNDIYISQGREFTEICFGGQGADYIEADGCTGGYEGDLLRGGDGDDRIVAKGEGYKRIYGEDGNDIIECQDLSQNNVFGGNGDDHITGGPGPDNLYGGSGNDTIAGMGDTNFLFGETGSDVLFGGRGNDYMYGGAQNDTLHGYEGNDELHGGPGGDYLHGMWGDDELWGDDGLDYLEGGEGNDRFHRRMPDDSDIVTDFYGYGYNDEWVDDWFT